MRLRNPIQKQGVFDDLPGDEWYLKFEALEIEMIQATEAAIRRQDYDVASRKLDSIAAGASELAEIMRGLEG